MDILQDGLRSVDKVCLNDKVRTLRNPSLVDLITQIGETVEETQRYFYFAFLRNQV
jgi:hypothetical protein